MLTSIGIPFLTILLAEVFDKSQLAVLLLATKTNKYFQLLIGVMIAFVLVDGTAIVFGSWIAQTVPSTYLKLLSGGLFVLFGILTLRKHKEERSSVQIKRSILTSSFLLVFVSEWGDKTQLASGVFAATYDPLAVFFGVILALFFLSAAAIFAGRLLKGVVKPRSIEIISGITFILLGIVFLLT